VSLDRKFEWDYIIWTEVEELSKPAAISRIKAQVAVVRTAQVTVSGPSEGGCWFEFEHGWMYLSHYYLFAQGPFLSSMWTTFWVEYKRIEVAIR
jgi:hypothetical protein